MAKVYEGKVIIPMEKMDEFLSLTSIRNRIAISFTSARSMYVQAPMPFHHTLRPDSPVLNMSATSALTLPI